MEFINKLNWNKIPWLLDTEEKVAESRRTLEESTREAYEEIKKAKLNTLIAISKIILD